jgi:D-alanine-D-alanine ligase
MHRIRVGVLRGGPSSEYEISLKTGATVLNNLSQEKYNPRDIFIDKEGQWHMHGLPVLPHSTLPSSP